MKQFCPLRKTQPSTAEPNNNDSQINVNVSLSTNGQDKPAERVDTPPPNDVRDKLVQQVDTPPPNEPMDSESDGFITVSKVKKT